MKIKIITALALMLIALCCFAVESSKPSSHDASWMDRHGKFSKANMQECMECHNDRVSCIKCHQDTEPRNHTLSWVKKGHGIEARWDRESCETCHREDSCIECHESTPPSSHRPGWREPVNRHCDSACHYPVQDTTCYACHKSAHAPNEYKK
jgi:hypothetical protein